MGVYILLWFDSISNFKRSLYMKKSLATLCALFLFVSIALAETSET